MAAFDQRLCIGHKPVRTPRTVAEIVTQRSSRFARGLLAAWKRLDGASFLISSQFGRNAGDRPREAFDGGAKFLAALRPVSGEARLGLRRR
jgi:hypothetical protein